MPRLDIHRIDLGILIGKDSTRVVSGEIIDEFAAATPDELGIQLATSPALRHWSGLVGSPTNSPVLDRITIDIRDLKRQNQPWESAAVRLLRDNSLGKPGIVRISPVRPRSANFPFTLPLRILEVNSAGEDNVLNALNSVFHNNSLEANAAALQTTKVNLAEWGSAELPADWPNADILHFDSFAPLPQAQLSGDAAIPGTLGWFAEKVIAWQVRLIVLRALPGKSLENLRHFAAALVARGGPAVLIEAFTNSIERRLFYGVFYEQLIHDFPIDWMWQKALSKIATNPFDASLFAGAGREEQVRSSNVALSLWQFASPGNARIRRESLHKVFIQKAPSSNRRKLTKTLESSLASIHSVWQTYRFDFREGEGMLPLSKVLSDIRLNLAGPVSATDLLSVSMTPRRTRPSTRFVNCSFWSAHSGRDLALVDQKTGSFQACSVYHLGIQIGPKSARVITANETALVEEIFKWTPEMKGVWIEIGVSGIDFDIIGDPVQRVWLPAPHAGPTEIVYFAVMPRETGINRLRFAVYYEQNVIQSFRVAVIVGTPPPDRAAALARVLQISKSNSRDAVYLPLLEFSLAPSIERFAAEPAYSSRALAIVANDWNDDSVITVKGASGFSVSVSKILPDLVKKLHDELRTISNLNSPRDVYPFSAENTGTRTQLEDALRTLADRGNMLFVELFNSVDWKDLQETLDAPDRIIQIAQILRDKVIPWSFVYGRVLQPRPGDRDATGKLTNIPVCLAPLPDADGNLPVQQCGEDPKCPLHGNKSIEPENIVCPLQFWGFKHLIEIPPQQIERRKRVGGETAGVRTSIPVNGSAALVPGVNCTLSESAHFQQLTDLRTKIPLAPIQKQYTAAGLKEHLASEPVHIAYFFCHAAGGVGSVDSQVILEAPATGMSESILWHEFAQLLKGKRKWDPPALVFLNGCKTANYSPEALSPFLRSFVDQLGASGLIGTEMTVWDVFAAEIAYHFFNSFLNGDSAGQALLKTRRIILSKNNPLGLIYNLYASADLHLEVVPEIRTV